MVLRLCLLGCSATILAAPQAAWAAPFKLLHTFAGTPGDGNEPNAQLLADSAGNFYSTTIMGGASNNGTVFRITPRGKTTIVYSFAGSPGDGAASDATLIADNDGNLYGTTIAGGADNAGTVFRLSPSGTETVLYAFKKKGDGAEPFVGVTADANGNLYGDTFAGGASGMGTVFKLSPRGKETILHSFAGTDGASPEASLILDASGNLYGTTTRGGVNSDGVVFKIAPDGTETVLHDFSDSDGAAPYGGLVADMNGNFYGTTGLGGTNESGVVFKLAPDGAETVLYAFTGGGDGAFPSGNLIFDGHGSLYGTTVYGGHDGVDGCINRAGCGIAYRLAPNGKLKVLHAFTGTDDGGNPSAALTLDKSGALYGTAGFNGANQEGTVFRIK